MSLEAKIDLLIAALDRNTEARKGDKAGAAAATPAAAAAPAAKAGKTTKPKGPTAEEVKAAAVAYAEAHGKPAAKALITKHGGKDLASMPESSYAAFIAACQEGPDDGDDGDDDDGL